MSRNKFVDRNQSLLFDFNENISNDGFMQCTSQNENTKKTHIFYLVIFTIFLCVIFLD